MSTALDGILNLFAILFVMLFTTDFVMGYSLGTWLVGASFFYILIRFVLWLVGRTDTVGRSLKRSGKNFFSGTDNIRRSK